MDRRGARPLVRHGRPWPARQRGAYVPDVKKAQELRAAGETGPNAELLALNRTSRGVVLQTLISIVVLVIIVDMIWKPGA